MNDKPQFEEISMHKWAEAFNNLYNQVDKERCPEEFWNSVMAHLSGVGEAIRKTSYMELVEESAFAFCWMCGFISKCNDRSDDPLFHFENCLSEIVALKFPDRCGYCNDIRCHCDPISKEKEKDKSAIYQDLLIHWEEYVSVWPNKSFNAWLKKLKDIFGGRIHIQSIETIGFHMLEEAGEEAKCLFR